MNRDVHVGAVGIKQSGANSPKTPASGLRAGRDYPRSYADQGSSGWQPSRISVPKCCATTSMDWPSTAPIRANDPNPVLSNSALGATMLLRAIGVCLKPKRRVTTEG